MAKDNGKATPDGGKPGSERDELLRGIETMRRKFEASGKPLLGPDQVAWDDMNNRLREIDEAAAAKAKAAKLESEKAARAKAAAAAATKSG